MTPRTRRTWQIDWAGPHGTAWGTANACLTTVTLAWLVHFAEPRWPIPTSRALLGAVIGTIAGVIVVLLRAAFSRRRRPAATIVYQVCCWVGAGGWIAYMASEPSWPWRWWLIRIGALVVMALAAGIAAALASADPSKVDTPAPQTFDRTRSVRTSEAQRTALGGEWRQRLARIVGGDDWKIPNIQMWQRGNGYTVEASAPAGYSWRSVDSKAQELADDMDLPYGGAVVVSMGITRRTALIEVTTVDILAGDYPYPENREMHSICDDLRVGLRDDGEPIGPNLRQQCMVIAGEAGSGKSNAGNCYTAEIVTTDDALEWDWDLTGKKFSAWLDLYLKGEIATPPIDWCARDGQELLWMTRAALRVGLARSSGYAQLMLDEDDDKVPVSSRLPEVIVVGDEIARVTSALSEHPEACNNLRLITFEHRAAAVRAVFLALRGTDDVLLSSIQSQCHVTGVMKIKSKAEAGWVFGQHNGFGPEDTPYPGCGGLSLSSGEPPIRLKYHRMTPSTIRAIARLAEPRRPALDDLSRLAANGRNPDGSPMADLLPGELDCYDTRWARYRARYASRTPLPSQQDPVPVSPAAPGAQQLTGSGAPSPAQAVADLGAAMANLDRAVQEANSRNAAGADDAPGAPERERVDLADGERDEFARLMDAEGFGEDWTEADNQPETAPQPSDEQVLLELVEAAGERGIAPRDLKSQLAGRGIVISRDTLHERLRALRDDRGLVFQPSHGRWARRRS